MFNPGLPSILMSLFIRIAIFVVVPWSTAHATALDSKPLPVGTYSIKVGFIPITDCSQIYVAAQTGISEKHGINIKMVPFAGGAQILQALSTGAIDVAFSNLASVVFYQRNVGDLVQLAGGTLMNKQHSEAGIVVRADSGINNISDLRGKTIAVNTFKNIVDLALLRLLRRQKIQASDVRLVELPFKDMEVALRGGKIDAATLPEPILTRALKGGGLHNLGDHFILAFGEIYSTGYFTTKAAYNKQKSAFDQFNMAIRDATPASNAFDEETLKAVANATSIPIDLLKVSGRARFVKRLPKNAIDRMRAWMSEEGFL